MQVQDAQRIRAAVDGLAAAVRAVDLGCMLPATHVALVSEGERIERIGRTLKSLAAAKVAESAAWEGEGDRSVEDWLARTTGTTRNEAQSEIKTGKRLHEQPEVAEAAAAGDLSAKQAEAIAGAAAANPGAARRLINSAKKKSLKDLKDECRKARSDADPDPDATRRRIHANRSYRTWTDAEGVGHIHLSGPSDVIARIDNAVRHRCERIFRDARRDGRREPSEAYGFDAATELLTQQGEGTAPPAGADAKIIVRVDLEALLRGRALDGETCEIAGLGPIPVSVVREWMDNAFLAAIVTKGTDITKVVHLGRRFTSEQRTALQWKDPVCARKGCGNRLGLEYDHVEDWAATHTTRVQAGQRLCRACHRLKTLGWKMSAPDDEGLCTLTPPDRWDRPPDPGDEASLLTHLADAVQSARRARDQAMAGA